MAYNFLIVDDSSTTRALIKKIITFSRINVGVTYEAENGRKAIDLLRNSRVDLVFSDINMPEMDGMEMIDAMAADDALKAIPVVIISSDGSEKTMELMSARGVRAFLRKPFTPEMVKEVSSGILGGGGHGQ